MIIIATDQSKSRDYRVPRRARIRRPDVDTWNREFIMMIIRDKPYTGWS